MKTKLPKNLADRIEHYRKLFEGTAPADVLARRVARAKEYLARSTYHPDGRTIRAIMSGTCMVFYRTDEPGVLALGTGEPEANPTVLQVTRQ